MILRLPTIFLDFDGVLHGESEVGSRPFNRLPLLEEALGKTEADFQIVISSSWRFHYTLEELKAHLGSLKRYVVGVTPLVEHGSQFRYREIMEVVETHGLVDWIVIDDADYAFPRRYENLLWSDPRTGLTSVDVELVVSWLNQFT